MAYGLENLFLMVLDENGVPNTVGNTMPLPDISQARIEKLAQGTVFEPYMGFSQPLTSDATPTTQTSSLPSSEMVQNPVAVRNRMLQMVKLRQG